MMLVMMVMIAAAAADDDNDDDDDDDDDESVPVSSVASASWGHHQSLQSINTGSLKLFHV